jgi:branched-chain amino acid transport system substrate-binding protein
VRRVHASLPLSGPAAASGREVLQGARLVLETRGGEVELVAADSYAPNREARAAENAGHAAADPAAVAYLGDFHSSQIAVTAPLLAAAGLLAVAPVATDARLGGGTLVRLTPDDGAVARDAARWMAAADVGCVLVVHDHDEEYGVPVAAMCTAAAEGLGIHVRVRPVWDHEEHILADVGDAHAVLYVGVAGSGAVRLWHLLNDARPEMWLLGTEAVAAPWLAAELPPAAAARTRFFLSRRGPYELYGVEAMALILDAVDAAAGDRAAVARMARAARDRDSVLGRYSIDDRGATTLERCGRLAVVDGLVVWDSAAPAVPGGPA